MTNQKMNQRILETTTEQEVKMYDLSNHRQGDTLPLPQRLKVSMSIFYEKLIPRIMMKCKGLSLKIENQKAY